MFKLKKSIIIDGPDLAGKTTLRDALQKALQCTIRETRIGRIDNMIEKTLVACADITNTQPRILDRCHFISDMVYDPIVVNKPSIFEQHLDKILPMIKQHATVIYLEPAIYQIEQRYAERGDDLRTLPEIIEAHTRYQEWFNKYEDKIDCIRLTGPFLLNMLIQQLEQIGTIEQVDCAAHVQKLIDTAEWEVQDLGEYLLIIAKFINHTVESAVVKKTGTCADEALGKAFIKNKLVQMEAYRYASM